MATTTRRCSRRVLTREVLWNGNTETLTGQFFSRDSLFIWFFKMHWKQRRRYRELFAERPAGLALHRFTRPEEAERFLRSGFSSAGS